MNLKMIIKFCLIIIWMITIFLFSHQPAQVSTKQSTSVITTVLKVFNKQIENKKIKEAVDKFEVFVRKSAHFFIYSILGFLLFIFLKDYNLSLYKVILLSIFICFIYACSDEIHQMFIPGRSNEIKDVFLDTVGSSSAVLLSSIFFRKKGGGINEKK